MILSHHLKGNFISLGVGSGNSALAEPESWSLHCSSRQWLFVSTMQGCTVHSHFLGGCALRAAGERNSVKAVEQSKIKTISPNS